MAPEVAFVGKKSPRYLSVHVLVHGRRVVFVEKIEVETLSSGVRNRRVLRVLQHSLSGCLRPLVDVGPSRHGELRHCRSHLALDGQHEWRVACDVTAAGLLIRPSSRQSLFLFLLLPRVDFLLHFTTKCSSFPKCSFTKRSSINLSSSTKYEFSNKMLYFTKFHLQSSIRFSYNCIFLLERP